MIEQKIKLEIFSNTKEEFVCSNSEKEDIDYLFEGVVMLMQSKTPPLCFFQSEFEFHDILLLPKEVKKIKITF